MFFHKTFNRFALIFIVVFIAETTVSANLYFSPCHNEFQSLSPVSKISPISHKTVNGFSTKIEIPIQGKDAYGLVDGSGKAAFTRMLEDNETVNRILIPAPFDDVSRSEPDEVALFKAYNRGEISEDEGARVMAVIEAVREESARLESFIIYEILQNSYDSIIDKAAVIADKDHFAGKITVEVFHDNENIIIRVIDNGIPIELNKAGMPEGRDRNNIMHFGFAGEGAKSATLYLADLGGAIRWYPLADGTMTEIKVPRLSMSSRFEIKEDESIELASAKYDLERMAHDFISLVTEKYREFGGERIFKSENTLITVGGNSFVRPGEKATEEEQLRNLRASFSRATVELLQNSTARLITHGNGPQVGIVLETLEEKIGKPFSDMGDDEVDRNLTEYNVVERTQVEIGNLIKAVLMERDVSEDDIKIITTHVLVDPDSEEYKKRTKPIGKVPAGGGERKKVGSPLPVEIVEIKQIADALKQGKYVIAVGGGGIPVDINVYREKGVIKALPAVIDKDYATALLAGELRKYGINIDELIISTGEPYIYENYGTAGKKAFHLLTPAEITRLIEDDPDGINFPEGKVRPKLMAAAIAVSNGVKRVRITSPENVEFKGRGTLVVPDGLSADTNTIVIGKLSKNEQDEIRGNIFTHADGVGITSTIKALHDNGVLKLIYENDSISMGDIISRAGYANRGYLHVALYLLDLQGWVNRRGPPSSDDMVFSLTEDGRIAYEILTDTGGNILPVYGKVVEFLPIADKIYSLLYTSPRGPPDEKLSLFKYLINLSKKDWGLPEETDMKREKIRRQIINQINGVLAAPSMVALKWDLVFDNLSRNGNKLNVNGGASGVNAEWLDAIFALLENQGWAVKSNGHVSLTNEGAFAAGRAWAYGVTVSYISLLAQVDELIFGQNPAVWKGKEGGAEIETHVNRGMNTIASGASHRIYFRTIDENVIRIFNLPIDEQPKYVIDIGSGDGTLLEHIYKLVMEKTERGRLIKENPDDERYKLLMVGVDLNYAARNQTHETLKRADVPHAVFEGNVNDPDGLAAKLKDELNIDIGDAVFVRSFLDHNRTYIKPAKIDEGRKGASLGAFSYEGRAIANEELEQNLVDHLRGWSKYVGKFGLLLMELHTITPALARENQGVTPAVAYYATHGYSDQYIIEYAEFIKAAKEAGLVAYGRFGGLYPSKGKLDEPVISINLFVSNKRAAELYVQDFKDTIDSAVKSEKIKIVFLLGKNWIADYEKESKEEQSNFLRSVISSARKYFEEKGIIFMEADDESLPGIIEKVSDENKGAKIVVMAKEISLSGEALQVVNREDITAVGINTEELFQEDRNGKDTVNIPILPMMEQALKILLYGKHDEVSSVFDIKKKDGYWVFTPQAIPIDYEELREVSDIQTFA